MEDKDFETIEDLDVLEQNSNNVINNNYNQNNIIKEQKMNDISNEVRVQTLPNEMGRVKNVGIEDVSIIMTSKLAYEKNLIDHHVILETSTGKKIVGTLISLSSEIGKIKLIGEISDNRFVPGVINKPSIGNICFAATDEETKMIVVDDQNNVLKKVLIGNMPLYNNTPAYVSTNTFFSNHYAIFGNTGSGKSCGVSRLFQNIFFNSPQTPRNACVFIFDAYGEYESALSVQNSQVFFKKYSTNVRQNPQNLIKLPLWLLDIDDFALLLEVDDPTQLPIIEKALRLVTIFSGSDEETKIYKNDIIAIAFKISLLHSETQIGENKGRLKSLCSSFLYNILKSSNFQLFLQKNPRS